MKKQKTSIITPLNEKGAGRCAWLPLLFLVFSFNNKRIPTLFIVFVNQTRSSSRFLALTKGQQAAPLTFTNPFN